MKRSLLFLLLLTATFQLHSQDTIYKKNGSIILGKVSEIGQDEVKFKRTDLPDGPTYTEKRTDLQSIHYSNGTKDVFTPTPENTKAASTAGKDVKPRYVLTMTDATKLKGTIIKEGNKEIIFLDDNIGERTLNRNLIASLDREFGDQDWIIKLNDGAVISGKIISKDENETIVQTRNLGNLKLNNSKIRSIDPLDGTVAKTGKFWFRNPCSLYFLTPTAIPMRQGEGYYHNYYGMGNEFAYAFTDHVAVGGGLTGPLGVYLNAKASTTINTYAHVSGGIFFGNSIFPIVHNSNFGIGMGFCSFTVGNLDNNLTAAVSYGFINNRNNTDWMNQPLFQLSGMVRVSKKIAIVSENWFVSVTGDPLNRGFLEDYHYEPFISYGARILNKRGSFDIGFINTPALWENSYMIGIPYIGFVVHMGKQEDD